MGESVYMNVDALDEAITSAISLDKGDNSGLDKPPFALALQHLTRKFHWSIHYCIKQ